MSCPRNEGQLTNIASASAMHRKLYARKGAILRGRLEMFRVTHETMKTDAVAFLPQMLSCFCRKCFLDRTAEVGVAFYWENLIDIFRITWGTRLMAYYCPCKRKCSGFSGTDRKCKRVSTSSSMPSQFLSAHVADQGSTLGKVAVGLAGLFGGVAAERAGSKITYQVWECPACACQTLVSIVKTPTGTQESKVSSLTSCR